MYEVEVKVPATLEVVRDRLEELEAEAVDAVVQEDIYYNAPHRSFAETDEALRVRTERAQAWTDERTRLTYKGPLVDDESKTREEFETAIEDPETIDAILDRLGFEPAAAVRKDREHFRLDEYTVTLDAVDGVGEFVEVETEAEKADLENAREGAFAVLERLGLDPDDGIQTSYLEFVLDE
ncbi:class IV adenylate cyclase [Natrialbaceae archaeon A-gly3]